MGRWLALAVAAAAAVALLSAVVALAGDPRTAIAPSDAALAHRELLTISDLNPMWQRLRGTATWRGSQFSCRGYDPDLSPFTITGLGHVSFRSNRLSRISEDVVVFRSQDDAVGAIARLAQPAFFRCVRKGVVQALRATRFPVRSASLRTTRSSAIGDRSISSRLITVVNVRGIEIRSYADMVIGQRGRSVVVMSFDSAFYPLPHFTQLERLISARMA